MYVVFISTDTDGTRPSVVDWLISLRFVKSKSQTRPSHPVTFPFGGLGFPQRVYFFLLLLLFLNAMTQKAEKVFRSPVKIINAMAELLTTVLCHGVIWLYGYKHS